MVDSDDGCKERIVVVITNDDRVVGNLYKDLNLDGLLVDSLTG